MSKYFDYPIDNASHKKLTPQQTIRFFCLACQGGHELPWPMADGKDEPPFRPIEEVKACTNTECWLWLYRTGRCGHFHDAPKPRKKRTISPEHLEKMRLGREKANKVGGRA